MLLSNSCIGIWTLTGLAWLELALRLVGLEAVHNPTCLPLRTRSVRPAHAMIRTHLEHCQGEASFGDHVQDCETHCVAFRIPEKAQALSRYHPPAGERWPCEPHRAPWFFGAALERLTSLVCRHLHVQSPFHKP